MNRTPKGKVGHLPPAIHFTKLDRRRVLRDASRYPSIHQSTNPSIHQTNDHRAQT